jgi:predicted HicB family RNase H-like nuclease
MGKKVSIPTAPRAHRASDNRTQRAEEWIQGATPGKMKRFTIDVPEELHRRVRWHCMREGVSMANYVRGLLEKDLRS